MQTQAHTRNSFAEDLYTKAKRHFDGQSSGSYANSVFYAKGILLLLIYAATYLYFILAASSFAEMLVACFILGICHVFIPVNMSHDAIHQSISSKNWINTIFLYGFEITGTNSYMYGRKHLEAHLNKENGSKKVAIESQGLLLQKQNGERAVNLPVVFYLLYSQYLIFIRDFILFFQSNEKLPAKELLKLFFYKIAYCIGFIVVPLSSIKTPIWQIIVCLLFMYIIVTLVAVIILLMPTEKMESTRVNDDQTVNDRWLIEVLEHNVDFSPGSTFLNLVAGGANLNVVHYLFPAVNHVHYNKLAILVEETAAEYGQQYRKQVLLDVFGIHFNYLKNIQSDI